MSKDIQEHMIAVYLHTTVKHNFIASDELVLKKLGDTQQSMKLTFPEHFDTAQRIFDKALD
jgi:hypothetical protein